MKTETTESHPAGIRVDDPLLSYDLITTPHPLEVGTQHANITIVVTNRHDKPVHCRQIAVALSIGPNASDIAHSTENIIIDAEPLLPANFQGDGGTRDWTAISLQDGVVIIVPAEQNCPIAPVQKSQEPDGDIHGLVIRISNIAINDEPGTGLVEILETATLDPLQWRDSPRTLGVRAPKFPKPSTPPPSQRCPFWYEDTNGNGLPVVSQHSPATKNVRVRFFAPHAGKYIIKRDGSSDGQQEVTATERGEQKAEFTITRDTTFILFAKNDNQEVALAATTAIMREPKIDQITISGVLNGSPWGEAGSLITENLTAKSIHVTGDMSGNPTIEIKSAGYGRMGK